MEKSDKGGRDAESRGVLWTVGHSNLEFGGFLELLKGHGIEVLADVRSFPGSRRLPHFNAESLAGALPAEGIVYLPMKGLGGRRKAVEGSPNTGWRNEGFQGYADYMGTEEFAAALEELMQVAAERRTAIMCAEAVPWRCHRNLVSDAVVLLHGWEVRHIMSAKKADVHKPMSFAQVVETSDAEGRRKSVVRYPAEDLFAGGG